MISQAALTVYLKSGMFKHFKEKISNAYYARAKTLQKSLQTQLPMYESSSEMVMHNHIVLSSRLNMNSLMSQLYKQKILIDSIDRNYLDHFYRERMLKINVSNVDKTQIDKGFGKVVEAINNPNNYYL